MSFCLHSHTVACITYQEVWNYVLCIGNKKVKYNISAHGWLLSYIYQLSPPPPQKKKERKKEEVTIRLSETITVKIVN